MSARKSLPLANFLMVAVRAALPPLLGQRFLRPVAALTMVAACSLWSVGWLPSTQATSLGSDKGRGLCLKVSGAIHRKRRGAPSWMDLSLSRHTGTSRLCWPCRGWAGL
jgi:hypothetical protein